MSTTDASLPIRYDVLHEYAVRHRIDYNGLCAAVRAALAQQAPAVAPSVPLEWSKAVQEAYGWLWNINNEPLAPIPLLPEGKAAYQARKALRDLLTTEQRGEAINAVRGMLENLGALPAVTECADNDSPWLVCKTCAAAGKCAQQAPAAEPVAALLRVRSVVTWPHRAIDGKTHYSEWGEWMPTTYKHAKAVTDPSRNTDPVCYEMRPLYAAPQPPQAPAAEPVDSFRAAKWLDPKCYEAGCCQSLKFATRQAMLAAPQPPQAQPQPLTDEQIEAEYRQCYRAAAEARRGPERKEWTDKSVLIDFARRMIAHGANLHTLKKPSHDVHR